MSNERIKTYEEDIAELRNTHFDTRLDERVATAAMFNRLLDELKRCYDLIDKLRKRPLTISCEHCSHIYEEEYLHEMLEMGPNGECVMCLEEASE